MADDMWSKEELQASVETYAEMYRADKQIAKSIRHKCTATWRLALAAGTKHSSVE